MWVNNDNESAPDFEVTTADFGQKFTDTVRFGKTAIGSSVTGTDQSYILDSYEARRQTFIGNTCAP